MSLRPQTAGFRLIRCKGIAVMLAAGSYAASAQEEGERLVEEARCYACHEMEEPSLGPSYVAIAALHSQRREVMTEVLARKIVHGGGGNWGLVPMVPNQWVSIEEARIMAEWILDLAAEQ